MALVDPNKLLRSLDVDTQELMIATFSRPPADYAGFMLVAGRIQEKLALAAQIRALLREREDEL